MAFEQNDAIKESKIQKMESSSLFNEAFSGLAQMKNFDRMQNSGQTDVNQMFGSLELFDSSAEPTRATAKDIDLKNDGGRREPEFKRDGPDPNRPEVPFEPTGAFADKVLENVKKFDIPKHVEQIPGALKQTLGTIADAWGF